MSGSYTSFAEHTAENECVRIHGVFERKEQPDDIPEVWEYEVCIQEQRVLVQRILC